MTSEWLDAQTSELDFWTSCVNTYGEETKQLVYLRLMGFERAPTWRTQYAFDAKNRSFLDLGGGPVSALLKFDNLRRGKVVDPCPYQVWVAQRYAAAGLEYERKKAEDVTERGWDIGLMYNVLQHVVDPQRIVWNLVAAAGEVHIFEWIDVPAHEGHPHELRARDLEKWTAKAGRIVELAENECYGRAWVI